MIRDLKFAKTSRKIGYTEPASPRGGPDLHAELGRLLARNERLEAEVHRLEGVVSRMKDPHEGDY